MEEQLISFETAKLAKEKGFYITGTFHNIYTSKNEDLEEVNDICLKYDEDGYDFSEDYREDYLKHFNVISWVNSANFTRFYHPEYLAPTQSLLAKWLREVYNIHLIAYKNINIDGYDWCYITTDGITNINSYKTYEEAYEIGLYQALLLL